MAKPIRSSDLKKRTPMSLEKPGKSGATLGREINWLDHVEGRIATHRGRQYQSSRPKGSPARRDPAPRVAKPNPQKKTARVKNVSPSVQKQKTNRDRYGRGEGRMWKTDFGDTRRPFVPRKRRVRKRNVNLAR